MLLAVVLLPLAPAVGTLPALAALVCAAVGAWRSRGGHAVNRGRAVTALIGAPVVLVAAVALTPPVAPVTAEPAAAERADARAAETAARERAAEERAATERAEQERLAQELAAERRAAEQTRAEQAERERLAEERAEQERADRERAEQERADGERADRERAQQQRAAAADPAPASVCNSSTHYVNADGNCIPRPTEAASPPAGATAQCKNGSYSFSQNRSGTCSRNGGVARWL
ncbi:DUF3761 domain-containing protein [Pseudonocardia sp. NPDC049635]|uniref:DUF3761 domain-containing protein n=1 Tax=Pseudonocardia sp. NPDC049635 TaxID=3155506 RepID=UPI003400AF02